MKIQEQKQISLYVHPELYTRMKFIDQEFFVSVNDQIRYALVYLFKHNKKYKKALENYDIKKLEEKVRRSIPLTSEDSSGKKSPKSQWNYVRRVLKSDK